MSITLEQFVASVESSGMLSADDVRSFHASLPPERMTDDPQKLARELVDAGKLTRYQAAAVYQGKAKGLIFGEYTVLDRIGAGGMGQVFKAQHRRMKRIVALKVLPAAIAKSPDAVKRFQREVEAAAKLSHPNIVTAHDAGEQDGQHFLVMEFVEGMDLSNLVKKQGPLSVDQAVGCTLQVARALAYVHGQGIIHRDIKPANLLVDKHGHVKVLDLGIARLCESPLAADAAAVTPRGGDLTQSGSVLGTIDYMAPEQAIDTSQADARSDIYSLGCTLQFLLTGEPVFGGDTLMKRLVAHRDAPIPSLRAKRPEVPEAVDALFRRMVAKRPEDRPQSAASITAELTKLQQPTAAIEPIAPAKTSRLPLVLGVSGVSAVALVIAAVVGMSIFGGGGTGTPPDGTAQSKPAAPASNSQSSTGPAAPGTALADMIDKVDDGIVLVRTFGADGKDAGLGSGFVIDSRGSIATNFHVIRQAHSARVEFKSGFKANVTGARAYSPEADLAILALESLPPKLEVLTLAAKEPLRQGAECIAFGHPRGFEFTVSTGIISAVRTTQNLPGELPKLIKAPPSQEWIQTTAAISGGNSGGPLLTPDGRVLGINTWGAPDGENLGFAAHVKHLVELQADARPEATSLARICEEDQNRTALEMAPEVDKRLAEALKAAEKEGFAPAELGFIPIQQLAEGLHFAAKNKVPSKTLDELRSKWTNSRWELNRQVLPLNKAVAEHGNEFLRGVFGIGRVTKVISASPETYEVGLLGRDYSMTVSHLGTSDKPFGVGESCLIVGSRPRDDEESSDEDKQVPPRVEAALLLPVVHDDVSRWSYLIRIGELLRQRDGLPQAKQLFAEHRPDFVELKPDIGSSPVAFTTYQMNQSKAGFDAFIFRTAAEKPQGQAFAFAVPPGCQITFAVAPLEDYKVTPLFGGFTETLSEALGHPSVPAGKTIVYYALIGTRLEAGKAYALCLRMWDQNYGPVEMAVAWRPMDDIGADPKGLLAKQALGFDLLGSRFGAVPSMQPSAAPLVLSASKTAPMTTTATPPKERRALPDSSAQEAAMKLVKEIFADDYAKLTKVEDKFALSDKLIRQASQSADDASGQYAMLVEARRLAIEAGDTGLFENSVAAIAEAFAVVELQMLAEGWEELLRKSRPLAVNKLVAEHALAKLEDEVSREDFDQASRLSKLALDAARKSRDNAVLKLAVDRDKRLATEQQQWQAMQAAFNTLKQQPDDPAANLLVGRNLCFVKGEWERGLAMLAKGSDAVLKDLATQSQTAPTAPAAQSELGDAWWKAAEAAKGNSKTELQAGAGYWYLMALPNISGLGKVKLEQRLKQIGLTVAANPSSGQPTRSLPTSPAGQPAAGLHPADAIAGGGHFYKAFTENISWNEAKLKCEKMGGYLVCITSAEENNFVIQVVESFIGQNMLGTENKKYYLGAFLENDEWKWVNGEPFNYTPNALSKDPARPYLRHARDRWMIASNVSTLVSGYVCEWDANTATKQKSPGLPVAKLQSERQIAEALWAARCRIALEVQGKRTGYLQEGATLPTTDFSVVEVRFDHNEQLGDQAIPALRGLPKLDKLMLNCRYVTDVGMASVAPLRGVRDLTLDGSQITDEGLSALKSLENLELLSMKSTAITGSGLASLRGHSKLRHLDLNSCRNFGDQGMTHLATLKSLGRLDLRNTQVTDAGIASLRGLKNIFQLEVSPATTDASLGVLTTFVGLKRLQLRDSQISDAGFAKLKAALPGCDVSR